MLTHILRGHKGKINRVDFSPDGKVILTSGHDFAARLWDAHRGALLHLLSGSSGTKVIGELSVLQDDLHAQFERRLGNVLSAVFSPDGDHIATAGEGNVGGIWDISTGELLAPLTGHLDSVDTVAFSPDGAWIVTASKDKTARIWNARTGSPIETLVGHDRPVKTAIFSPDGNLIATADDNSVRIWDFASGDAVQAFYAPASLTHAIFSSDGNRVVACGVDSAARIWTVGKEGQSTPLTGHTNVITAVAISPHGDLVATASWDGSARIWNARDGALVEILTERKSGFGNIRKVQLGWHWDHTNALEDVRFSPDSKRVVTTGADNDARIWDLATGKRILTVSHDGLEPPEILAWTEETGRPDTRKPLIIAPTTGIKSALLSSDGNLLITAGKDYAARVWNAITGTLLHTLKTGVRDELRAVAFSHDGKLVATANWGTAAVWDALTWKLSHSFVGHQREITSLSFSTDGKTLGTASRDNTVRLWDLKTGRATHTLTEHTGWVNKIEFSPQGDRIVSASSDQTARIWDVASGKPLAVLKGHGDTVYDATFSTNGKLVATASGDGSVRVYVTDFPTLLESAEDLLPRDLK